MESSHYKKVYNIVGERGDWRDRRNINGVHKRSKGTGFEGLYILHLVSGIFYCIIAGLQYWLLLPLLALSLILIMASIWEARMYHIVPNLNDRPIKLIGFRSNHTMLNYFLRGFLEIKVVSYM